MRARVGSFEIRKPLGAGGMGVVYQGFDVRLIRVVAIKVLSGSALMDPDAARLYGMTLDLIVRGLRTVSEETTTRESP